MRRLSAARRSETGVQIVTLPLLAVRPAGGFHRPARSQELEPATRTALDSRGFIDLEPMRQLPGMIRAVGWTLAKIWDADISLGGLAADNSDWRGSNSTPSHGSAPYGTRICGLRPNCSDSTTRVTP
jgi:hypothetical protein